jgi:hypothetical protein
MSCPGTKAEKGVNYIMKILRSFSRNFIRVSVPLFFFIIWGAAPSQSDTPPQIAGCNVFPADNVWNASIDNLPLDPNSSAYVNTIGASKNVHADFGSGTYNGGPIGIPYTTVPGNQPKVPVTFDYADESDPGPYPIPPNPPIEGGSNSSGDRHVLVLDRDNCILYELFYAFPQPNGSWHAGSGAIFDLKSNALRPAGWTSADAAGLPIMPGLINYDEVASGEIRHAIRFTAPQTRNNYIWPARHFASSLTGSQYPPMGQRFRLRANFDISSYSPEIQVILRALKKYGMILADNGSSWFISGVPDERWNNDHLHELDRVLGSDFEAIDESSLIVDPDSGQVVGGIPTPTPTPLSTLPVPIADAADYTGDGKADVGVFRTSTGQWFVQGGDYGFPFGLPGDVPVPGDYDGNGTADYGVWRPSTGDWHILISGVEIIQNWGVQGDLPVPGDYNGDGLTDYAVFKPLTGEWWILFPGGSATVAIWGIIGDIPAPADYDGDKKDDIAVFRPFDGTWYIVNSSNGSIKIQALGQNGDIPVPGDYDGDGRANLAVWRSSTGAWIGILKSGKTVQKIWGSPIDLPVPADYDGDGRTDLGLFRALTSEWWILTSSSKFTNYILTYWGSPGDLPVSASGDK